MQSAGCFELIVCLNWRESPTEKWSKLISFNESSHFFVEEIIEVLFIKAFSGQSYSVYFEYANLIRILWFRVRFKHVWQPNEHIIWMPLAPTCVCDFYVYFYVFPFQCNARSTQHIYFIHDTRASIRMDWIFDEKISEAFKIDLEPFMHLQLVACIHENCHWSSTNRQCKIDHWWWYTWTFSKYRTIYLFFLVGGEGSDLFHVGNNKYHYLSSWIVQV